MTIPAAAKPPCTVDLTGLLSEPEWERLRRLIVLARERGFAFALGGGLAFSAYSGRWRKTKDVDLFIRPDGKDGLLRAVRDAGYRDLYDEWQYDRYGIYRGTGAASIGTHN